MENIENKIKTTPKDFFVFIGAMVALYASAVSLLNFCLRLSTLRFPTRLISVMTDFRPECAGQSPRF